MGIWRSPEFLPEELVFNINYLGADQASFTLNFSKGASQIIGQYYQMIRLGKSGYRNIMTNLTKVADYFAKVLKDRMKFLILSQGGGNGLPLVAFRLDPAMNKHYDEFAIAHHLRERGWIVPAYTMAPHSDKLKLMRVVIREDFTKSRCDQLLLDIHHTLEVLDDMKPQEVKDHIETVKEAAHASAQKRKKHTHKKYKKQDHGLHGDHGKTQAVC